MKKNKTVAFMLAASLMVGGTFLGTKAWFTDEAAASNDLVVTMGHLNVDVEEGFWKVTTSEDIRTETNQSRNNGNIIKNAKPGDKFEKEVTITNNGSLTQELTVTQINPKIYHEALQYIDVEENISDMNGFVLAPGDSKTLSIKVGIKTEMPGDFDAEGSQNKTDKVNIDFNKLSGIFKIDAKQTANHPIQPLQ